MSEPLIPLPLDPEPRHYDCVLCGDPIRWDEVWLLGREHDGLYLHAQPCFQELLDETAVSV